MPVRAMNHYNIYSCEIMRLMPTLKQKLVASKLVENGGNMGRAMVSAGYSKATAKTLKS